MTNLPPLAAFVDGPVLVGRFDFEMHLADRVAAGTTRITFPARRIDRAPWRPSAILWRYAALDFSSSRIIRRSVSSKRGALPSRY